VLEREGVLNLCANNYLGLADHPEIVAAAQEALDAGATAWPRCGSSAGPSRSTNNSRNVSPSSSGTDDTILYSSCFDANGGLFETLLTAEDAIISDELNHASIIDGIRLCKAQRFRYKNNDMADLEASSRRPPAREIPGDRDRRRVLHGRHHRQPAWRSAIWPTSTTPW
jgi:glycine C-acetyltransferase